ncbi:hypothetical protein Vsou_02290 [Vulcanisaeta souniana JCM 11219]|uniref:Uncharacterized protein n=1 Tax=Vulcanisaeta souniana JCM 11219 TaxID=1293586 RepID=A0ABN6SQ50_9CREN|nr:hypothetical protein Vsou_02290 [Vulcanisaeta souniana JCM 11219]
MYLPETGRNYKGRIKVVMPWREVKRRRVARKGGYGKALRSAYEN